MEGYPHVRVVAVPYDSGHRGLRMGAGPGHLLDNGLIDALGVGGREAYPATLRPETVPTVEVATAFELDGLISDQVRGALAEGRFPWCSRATATPPSGRSPAPTLRASGWFG